MIPIDFQDFNSEEVDQLQKWLELPAAKLMRTVLEARCAKSGLAAMVCLADGDKEGAGEDALIAKEAQELLLTLNAASSGKHTDGREFEYQRVVPAITN